MKTAVGAGLKAGAVTLGLKTFALGLKAGALVFSGLAGVVVPPGVKEAAFGLNTGAFVLSLVGVAAGGVAAVVTAGVDDAAAAGVAAGVEDMIAD